MGGSSRTCPCRRTPAPEPKPAAAVAVTPPSGTLAGADAEVGLELTEIGLKLSGARRRAEPGRVAVGVGEAVGVDEARKGLADSINVIDAWKCGSGSPSAFSTKMAAL